MDFTLPLEIVVRILDFLPGKCLKICRCVCKCWKEASEIIFSKKSRLNLQTTSFIGQLKCSSFLTVLEKFLHLTPLAIHTIVVFTQTSTSALGDRKVCQTLQDTVKSSLEEDPSNCKQSIIPMVGCVVKYTFGPMLNNLQDLNTIDMVSGVLNTTSLLLFPQLRSYNISTFHIPMKKKYEMIKGYGSFLPVSQSRTSLVILFIHPVTLGRMTHLVKAIRRVYSPETCIIGIYSESCLFNEEVVTSNEMIGMSFSGDLLSFSTVISDSVETDDIKTHVVSFCMQMGKNVVIKDYTILIFIFACNSFGNGKALNILAQVRKNVPTAVVFGAYSTSVFGADHAISDSLKLPGGRDYLQTKGAVLGSLLIKRSGGFV